MNVMKTKLKIKTIIIILIAVISAAAVIVCCYVYEDDKQINPVIDIYSQIEFGTTEMAFLKALDKRGAYTQSGRKIEADFTLYDVQFKAEYTLQNNSDIYGQDYPVPFSSAYYSLVGDYDEETAEKALNRVYEDIKNSCSNARDYFGEPQGVIEEENEDVRVIIYHNNNSSYGYKISFNKTGRNPVICFEDITV